jgi:hypothetical protein
VNICIYLNIKSIICFLSQKRCIMENILFKKPSIK